MIYILYFLNQPETDLVVLRINVSDAAEVNSCCLHIHY